VFTRFEVLRGLQKHERDCLPFPHAGVDRMAGRRRGESLPIRALALNGEAVSRISLVLKALCELGLRQLGLYALYQVGLHSSYFRWRTPDCQPPTAVPPPPSPVPRHLLELPDPASVLEIIGQNGLSTLIKQADEIVAGRVRLFGGEAVALALTPPGDLSHWTKYEQGSKGEREKGSSGSRGEGEQGGRGDIKFIWEPARFGWAFTLGRAYYLTNDERYPEAFWRYLELFQQANPVNRGPNWVSAQEVALRLIVFAFAAQIFSRSLHSTATRISQLATSIAGDCRPRYPHPPHPDLCPRSKQQPSAQRSRGPDHRLPGAARPSAGASLVEPGPEMVPARPGNPDRRRWGIHATQRELSPVDVAACALGVMCHVSGVR